MMKPFDVWRGNFPTAFGLILLSKKWKLVLTLKDVTEYSSAEDYHQLLHLQNVQFLLTVKMALN